VFSAHQVSVEDSKLRGGGAGLRQKLWDTVKSTIEQWTGMEQKPTSMYGIREYTANAVLSPHVDRLPLVSSCIVNVAQDVDEDWPLEVYDRDGRGTSLLFSQQMQPWLLRIAHSTSSCQCSRECDNEAW
jgi:prolyl 4-hydroxylase